MTNASGATSRNQKEANAVLADTIQIIRGRPPNFEAIAAKFPAARAISTIFAYGDRIYSGGGEPLAHSLYQHELVHLRQQAAYDGGVENWWAMYLASSTFRLEQELEAHTVEYATLLRSGANRKTRLKARAQIAARLSGPLYGKMVSKAKAIAYLEMTERHS